MFRVLKMFEGLVSPFKLTLSELSAASHLRFLCGVEDWENAIAFSKKAALRIAETHSSGWIPEEVCQIYADLGLAYHSSRQHAEAIPMCERAISIARGFGYTNQEISSSANMGFAYRSICNHSKAIEALEHARRCMISIGHEGWNELLMNLADSYQVL